MPDAKSLSPMKRRVAAVRARFEAEGISFADWSREKGFAYSTVKAVLTGNRQCRFGESHKIAVALGLKDPPPSAAATPTADRLEGVRQ
ncbi:DNA-binding protein [Sphingomonas sp.]|jgi:gp16 family phage-associated protein|uniref:DNA-binding protein n=1 Tax=Sphingomonas sp. TaxID=28214 RepID=UPI003BAD89A1